MANMIPPVINPGTASRAEISIFARLKDELSGEWTVIHSMDIANVPEKIWGEADFVAIGPPGVFCLEVKGGRVGYDSTRGQWSFTDRNDNQNFKYEGPFEQANKANHGLLKYVKDQFPGDFLPLFGFGVMIPDVNFRVNRPEVVREILYDSGNHEETLKSYMARLHGYWRSKVGERPMATPMTRDRILEKLRGDLDLIPAISVSVRDVREELIKLTDEQEMIIGGLRDSPRAVIRGAAGTGKTMCAVKEAKTLAGQGKKVLFTCFNRRLARTLESHISDDRIDVLNIHLLMSNLIREAGYEFPDTNSLNLWEEAVPASAFNSIAELGQSEKYDALIIDEGQDLNCANYYEMVLDPLLSGGMNQGYWRMFMDNQQNIFGNAGEDVEKLFEEYSYANYTLTTNCRNTRQVARHTAILSGINDIPVCKADGPETSMSFYENTSDARRMLSRYVRNLLSQNINTHQIAILSPKTLQNSLLRNGLENCPFDLFSPSPDESIPDRKIGFYTIQSFKGLESDAVILVDLDDVKHSGSKVQNYVGASRAKVLLSVFVPQSQKDHYMELTTDWARNI